MLLKTYSFFAIVLISLLITSCNGGEMNDPKMHYSALHNIPETSWNKLAKKTIFFGHQSVGSNIIAGLKDIMKEDPRINLNIVELFDFVDFKNGNFYHSRIGKNRDPRSKTEEFMVILDKGIGAKTDFAFFKFCYVDFSNKTDVDQVFRDYKKTIKYLKEKYPKTKFIHFTVPLVSRETGFKPFIKRIIGRPIRTAEDNIIRISYNNMIIKEFSGQDPVFDLAKIESTLPDGRRSTFKKSEESIFQLAPKYTNDGGHLNKCGRKIVAEDFLVFLVNLIN